jgi:amino acid transporter
VIGVGIFLTTAGMVKSLGSPFWLLTVWLTTGVTAAGGAICFGALAARRPEAGGAYVYLKEARLGSAGGGFDRRHDRGLLFSGRLVGRQQGRRRGPRPRAQSPSRALLLGVTIVTFVYVLISFVCLYLVPPERIDSRKTFAALTGEALFGRAGGVVLSLIVVVTVLGSLAALLMAMPRVYFAMARDGLFFPAACAAQDLGVALEEVSGVVRGGGWMVS